MFIKEAVVKAGKRMFGEKELANWQDNFLVQFLFLTTIKNYFYGWATETNPFLVPKQVAEKAKKKRIALVLDMDETLVYTRRNSPPPHRNYLTTTLKGQTMYVELRPLVKHFLKAVAQVFTIYIYTAGEKKYADAVLNLIDSEGLIQKRFYRDSCRRQNGSTLKDLKHLRRLLKTKQEMVLVDDNRLSVEKNYPFAVEIAPFEGEQDDRTLLLTFEKVLKFYT